MKDLKAKDKILALLKAGGYVIYDSSRDDNYKGSDGVAYSPLSLRKLVKANQVRHEMTTLPKSGDFANVLVINSR